jgi:hypothetical protein
MLGPGGSSAVVAKNLDIPTGVLGLVYRQAERGEFHRRESTLRIGNRLLHRLPAVTSLSGSFSSDGNHFTATETESFTLEAGKVKTITFSWFGSRR